jgi:hypothetical protein
VKPTSDAKEFIRPAVSLTGSAILLAVLYLLAPEGFAHPGRTAFFLRILFGLWALGAFYFLLRLGKFLRTILPDSSSLIIALLRDGPHRTFWEIYRRHTFIAARLRMLYTFWGVVIVTIVVALSATRRVEDLEAEILVSLRSGTTIDSTSSVGILILESGDDNPTRYLRDLAQIVADLKKCGARGVVARIPTIFAPSALHMTLVDSIQRSGIAILFSGYGQPALLTYPFYYGHEKEPFSRDAFFIEPVLDDAVMTSYRIDRWLPVIRWSPVDTNPTPLAVDALTVAAARASGSPDSVNASLTQSMLQYGPIRVPLNSENRAAVLRNHLLFRMLRVSAVHELDADTLGYYVYPEWKSSRSFPMDEAGSVHDRIVFIESMTAPYLMLKWEMHACAVVVQSLIHDGALTEYQSIHPYASIVVVLLSALLCLRVRPAIAAPLIILSGPVLLALGVALLATCHVLLQVAYPVAAALLSGVIFPLARLSHENP